MKTIISLALLWGAFSFSICAQEMFETKVASIYISEQFVNEQLAGHLANSDLVKNLKMKLDPKSGQILLHGDFQLPLDDIRAIGIEKDLGLFKFQLSILPKVSRRKHLVLQFPLSETYFYQANSKNPKRDRVVIPTQLLSLGLASTRGYLAALSGDFSSFDRKTDKYKALLRGVTQNLKTETNQDAIAVLKSEKKSLELQIASTELERENFARTSKSLNSIFAFTSEKEFNLNNEVMARGNTVLLKIKLSKLVPYLKDTELGKIRIGGSNPNRNGERYLIFDINTPTTSQITQDQRPHKKPTYSENPPSIMIRLHQAVFTSKMILDTEKESMGDQIKDFQILFKDNGVHVAGKVRKFFMDIPFDGLVDFVTTGPDVFEVRLRNLNVFKMDLKFLTPLALAAVKDRLSKSLEGIATYKYLGKKDGSRALRVKIDPKKLIPAFPDFHLTEVDVRDRNFMLKIGRIK